MPVLALGLLLAMMGCGSGGSSQSPPPVPDFSMAVSPPSQAVNGGGSTSVSLSATPLNGFSSQISVQVTGAPTGVSVSPTSITLVPGTPQQVTFSASANVAYANATVTFAGTAGSLTHTAGLSLSVNSTFGGPPGRTRYVRSDATTEYFAWINQQWIVYNPNTSRFFVTDPFSNQVFVFDAASETEIGTISVPGAYGIDDTPDHTALYVGTLIGDVYAIDPVAMTVTQRYMASQIGPIGYLAVSALVLADGRLALLGEPQGIPSVDGSPNFAIWSPSDNSFSLYGANGQSLPCQPIFGFSRTVDRSKVIVAGGASPQELCEVDESTGTVTHVAAVTSPPVVTPDGKYIVLLAGGVNGSVYLLDAATLNPAGMFNLNAEAYAAEALTVSADSSTVFVMTDTIIYAYSLVTGQQVGWLGNIYVPPTSGGLAAGPINSPYLQATDGTGLFVGPLEEGLGFVDLSTLQTGPLGTQFTNAYLNPAAGPVSGGTQAQWGAAPTGKQGAIYFGSQESTQVTFSGDLTTATTPPGSPGAVPVYAFATDGGVEIVPDGFSYGPTILEVTPNMATAEGGGTGYIYGYGLGPVNSNAIPSDLQVTVAGVPAQITAFSPNAYGVESPPFQLEFAAYTIPSGVTGPADVTVTNNSGTTTAHGALTYLPPIQQFPLAGSTLAQGIYDSYTDLYYFTDTSQIQVFSRAQGKWLSPISIPAPQGATQRLWGIALSPGGGMLAVSDANAGVIYLLDPANPTSVKTFAIPSADGFIVNPCGVAISDAGNVYYAVFVQGGTGADQFFKLNTSTGTITDYHLNGPGDGTSDMYLRVAITSDNASVFFNELGNVFRVDTASDNLSPASFEPGCCSGDYELSLSSNQTQITANSDLYDSDLNGESFYALNDREILNISYVYGAKFSTDSRLLFQPSTNGIDVFHGELGNLRNRISLLVPLSSNYDALVDDGTDNILIAITGTGNGVAVVDLTSVPDPPALPYDNKVASRTHRLGELGNRWRGDSKLDKYSDKQNPRLAVQRRAVPHVTRKLLSHPEQQIKPTKH
jgi:hypothetical protein